MLPIIASIVQAAPGFLNAFSGNPQAAAAAAQEAADQRNRWIFGGVIFGGLVLVAIAMHRREN